MYYLGIDIFKKSFTVSILDEEGEAITKFLTFLCTLKGMEKLLDKICSLKLEKDKTDKVDSLVIAGLLRSKEALASYVPEDEVQVLRELVRLRHHLQKDKKNHLRKAYTLLNLVFPEYTNLIRSPFKKVSSMILKKYPTAVDMARARRTDLVKMARRIQGNNYSWYEETILPRILKIPSSLINGKNFWDNM